MEVLSRHVLCTCQISRVVDELCCSENVDDDGVVGEYCTCHKGEGGITSINDNTTAPRGFLATPAFNASDRNTYIPGI